MSNNQIVYFHVVSFLLLPFCREKQWTQMKKKHLWTNILRELCHAIYVRCKMLKVVNNQVVLPQDCVTALILNTVFLCCGSQGWKLIALFWYNLQIWFLKLAKTSLFKSTGSNDDHLKYLWELNEILQNSNSCAAKWSSS